MLDVRVVGVCPAHTHTQYQDYVLLIWAVTRIIVLNFGVSPPSKRKLLVFNRIVIASGHVLINCTRAGVYACERVNVGGRCHASQQTRCAESDREQLDSRTISIMQE